MYIDIAGIFPGMFMRVFCLVTTYYILIRSFTKDKINSVLNFIIFFASSYAVLALVTVIFGYPGGFGLIIPFAVCFLLSFFTLNEKPLQLVLYNITVFLVFFLLTFLCGLLTKLLFPDIYNSSDNDTVYGLLNFVMAFFIQSFFAFPINGLIRRFSKKDFNKISLRSFGYLLMPISQLFPFIVALEMTYHIPGDYFNSTDVTRFSFKNLIIIGICISFVADFYIFAMVDRTEDINKKNTALMLQNNKNDIEYNYVKQLQSDNESLHKMRHDVVNLNSSVAILIKNGDYMGAVEMLGAVDKKIKTIIPESFCGNNLINALLTMEKQKASEAGVGIKIDVICVEDMKVDSADLCSLFSNLIDNAIEAAERVGEGSTVAVNCKPINNMLAIHVTNPLPDDKKKKSFFSTSKGDKANHGIGTKIIKEIVKKYNGIVSYDIGDSEVDSYAVISVI